MKTKTKKGNVAVIAVIIMIVAVTAGVIGFMFVKKMQVPALQPVITQSTTPVAQTQPVQQAPTNEIADWKTYTNAKYGFSLKYPSSWNFGENEIPKSVQDSAAKGDGYIGPDVFNLGLGKDDPNNTDRGIDISVTKRTIKNKPILEPDIVEGTIAIDGQTGMKYSGSYFIEKNGYVYRLSSFGGDSYYDNLFDKIVATLKFSSVALQTGKVGATYTNAEYGFQFTMPQKWTNVVGDYAVTTGKLSDDTPIVEFAAKAIEKDWIDSQKPGLPKGYADLFTIGIISKTDWDKDAKECNPSKELCAHSYPVLGENGTNVFVNYLPEEGPKNFTMFSTVQEKIEKPEDVIKSGFKLLN